MGPPTIAAWSLCKVQGVYDTRTPDGEKMVKVTLPVEDYTSRRCRREFMGMPIPVSEAKLRAAAVAPGALVGAEIHKFFPGHGLFNGSVTGFSGRVSVLYKVEYEDGDKEEMNKTQVLEHLKRSMPDWTEFAPRWEAEKPPPLEDTPMADNSDAEEEKEEEEHLIMEEDEEEEEKLPAKRPREKVEQQEEPPGAKRQKKKEFAAAAKPAEKPEAATVVAPKAAAPTPPPADKPRKEKPAKPAPPPAASAVEAAAGPSYARTAAAPHPPSSSAVEADYSSLQGIWKPCGAGNARGVEAYSKKERKFLPIGAWIVDPVHRTLPGRFGVDHRHLERGMLASIMLAKNSVAGWIGVYAEGADPVNGRPVGAFRIGFYELTQAKRIVLDHPQLETEEEAARMYDRLALAYYGPAEADTNYPVDQAALDAVGEREDRAPRALFTSAVTLLNLASGVEAPGVNEWRERVLTTYVLRPPSAAATPSLAVELGWLVEQAPAESLVPDYSDKASRATFIADCRSCTEAGARVHHYDADADTCELCCTTKVTAHGKRTLCALITKAATFFLAPEPMHKSPAAARPRRSLAAPTRAGAGVVEPMSAEEVAALPKGLRVAVIGAGVAGLKAAAELQAAGAAVVVLEARRRVGGRIHTVNLKSSRVPRLAGFPSASAASSGGSSSAPVPAPAAAAVDVGAAFVLGIATDRNPVNPVVPYLRDVVGAATVPRRAEGSVGALFFDEHGDLVSQAQQLVAEAHFRELLHALVERESSTKRDERVADAVEAVLDGMVFTEPMQRRIVECMAADMQSAPLDKLSLSGSMSHTYSGAHGLVEGGFNRLTKAMAAGKQQVAPQGEEQLPDAPIKDLRLRCQVRKVVLGAGGVGVAIHTGATAEDPPISVDAAVVTLPLGVLQAGAVKFSPPLPTFKQQAVAGLGSSNETRVALLFDKPFWPVAPHCLRPLTGSYSFLNLHALGTPNALCAWVRPSRAARIAPMTDKELVNDVMAARRRMFGGKNASAASVPQPLSFRVVRWGTDPFAGGAHSYVPFGASKELFDWMALPVTGDDSFDDDSVSSSATGAAGQLRRDTRLFFAGEATHAQHPYSVEGAMESGGREAMRVLRWWKDHGAETVQEGGPSQGGH